MNDGEGKKEGPKKKATVTKKGHKKKDPQQKIDKMFTIKMINGLHADHYYFEPTIGKKVYRTPSYDWQFNKKSNMSPRNVQPSQG